MDGRDGLSTRAEILKRTHRRKSVFWLACVLGVLTVVGLGVGYDQLFSSRDALLQQDTSTETTSDVQPVGVKGNWRLVFFDDFNGTELDTENWSSCWFPLSGCGTMNEVTTSPENVQLADGTVVMTLASTASGALISSDPRGGAQSGFEFTDGYAEARVLFAGDGRTIYNWPAWWVTGQSWPDTGENDIAEGLGMMTVNYHSASGAHNQGEVSGVWAGSYHTYGVHRQQGRSDVYYDGALVKSYATDDGLAPHYLVFNIGTKPSRQQVFGAGSEMKVDYVRVWK